MTEAVLHLTTEWDKTFPKGKSKPPKGYFCESLWNYTGGRFI